MSGAFTSKVYADFDKAPRAIKLLGDKSKKSESAQHVIEFPGGAIEVSRTTDGDYWAHIIINRREVIEDAEGRCSALGQAIDSRIDYVGAPIQSVPSLSDIEQVAILIRGNR